MEPEKENSTTEEQTNIFKKLFRKKWVRISSIIAGVLIVLIIAGAVYANTLLSNTAMKLDENDLGISEEIIKEEVEEEKLNRIVNIALFGIDTTDGAARIGDQYRSDCIMVFTIDPIANQLKMTSILRDSKVPIEGHDPQKINAAYKYGGPQLAVKTLNQNFKTNIRDYVTVDFAHMAEVIDLVGGLTITITEAEAENMMQNNIIKPVKAGTHLLDGAQSVAYARVRKVDSDYYRASRQQKVLTLLFDKLKKIPQTDYPSMILDFMKCVETSLSYDEIIKYARSIDLSTAKIIKNTIPDSKYEKGLWGGVDETGSWVWVYNLDEAAARLREIIYGKSKTEEETTTSAHKPSGGSQSGSHSSDGTFYGGGSGSSGSSESSRDDSSLNEETTEDASDEDEKQTTKKPEEVTKPEETTSERPTEEETQKPTERPTEAPTQAPTEAPTEAPTQAPTEAPTEAPTQPPTEAPTEAPTQPPTEAPTEAPTQPPTEAPTEAPTQPPTEAPTEPPTEAPTQAPTEAPTDPPADRSTEAVEEGLES